MKLLRNPVTERKIEAYLARPSHGVIVSGRHGLGVTTAATDVAGRLAGSAEYVTHIMPEKTGITIDQVRELYAMTRSKAAMRRVIVLHDVDAMAAPAQNAFLKLLEEPPESTHFVLIAHNIEAVLPTIRSRAQSIELLPVPSQDSAQLLAQYRLTDAVKAQLLFVADGYPAELVRLASDAAYRDATFAHAANAKRLISGSRLEKLLIASRLSTNREACLAVLSIAARMCAFNLSRQATRQTLDVLKRLQIASDAIRANGNLKAQLLKVCV